MQIEVYDKIWIMENNVPTEMIVFAVVDSMDFSKRGSERHYHLVKNKCGAGWGNNEGIQRHDGEIYLSRQDVIDHI